jgi:hypothetical protein
MIKFKAGQKVRIVRVDEIPYGLKYSFLEQYLDKTGVIQEVQPGANQGKNTYTVRIDRDNSLITLSENALEAEE